MNNLIGEFGTTLAQARIDQYLGEAERVHLVSEALRERKAMAAAREARRPAARLWQGALKYVRVLG